MKNNFYIFILIINLSLLGCDNNYKQEILKLTEVEFQENEPIPMKVPIVTALPIKKYNFFFTDLENQTQTIKVLNNYYTFSKIKQPIVLINFLATWCPPCIGQIPHLNNLQKKYKDSLYILGTLIYNDGIKDKDVEKFIISQKINFFISKDINNSIKFGNFIAPKLKLKPNFSLPLMILFLNGKYYTHYEGSIPEEMIESDIKQALDKIK
ncbi:MAG: TlpA family protein disulfide reductase [Sulfurovaceae bacterium]|nr:TlpA family protein disulfide reductase [Sulfurovaceae bacterium]